MSVHSWPYRTPTEGRVTADSWLLETESPHELPAVLQGWDYSTDLQLSRRLYVDLHGCLADTGLPPDAPLQVSVRARPTTSLIRSRIARKIVEPGSPVEIRGIVQGSDLSGALTVETMLELAADIAGIGDFRPSRAGSVLWRDEVSTVLEGDSGLLPVAPVSFATAGLPAGAAWYLSLDAGQWNWAAMGSLILLLNSDNASVAAALADGTNPESVRLMDTMSVDFVADLVGRALLDEAFWESYVNPEEPKDDDLSVGALVRALARARLSLPTEDLAVTFKRLKDLLESDPSMYRARVQAGLGYLNGGIR